MIVIDRTKLGDLLKSAKEKRARLDAMGDRLTMPIPVSLDDFIWLLEAAALSGGGKEI